jgi:hypothetical protein
MSDADRMLGLQRANHRVAACSPTGPRARLSNALTAAVQTAIDWCIAALERRRPEAFALVGALVRMPAQCPTGPRCEERWPPTRSI